MSDREKWEFLEGPAIRHDARDADLRDMVRALWRASRGRPLLFAHLAHAVARDGIRQVEDSIQFGHEDIKGLTRPEGPALEALDRGADDCDAKARLFVALVVALHELEPELAITARMVPVWKGEDLAHVYGEVTIGQQSFPVETILARARIGDRAEDVPTERTSHRWLFSP